MGEKRSKILIADDIKSNINILVKILQDDYDLAYVQDGVSVLEYIRRNPVDLVLLDILMPEMNGYVVCERLKSNPDTSNIPVIFITSRSKEEDEAKGLQLGAVDYITKPFRIPIVKARVKNHLILKDALLDLKTQNETLRETARLREDVEQVTRHDLKSPLVSIIGYSEFGLLRDDLHKTIRESFETIRDSGYKMLEMINLSLDLIKMERGTYELDTAPVDLLIYIRKVLNDFTSIIDSKQLEPRIYINGEPAKESDIFIIFGEELLFYSMLSNLIKNAFEASPKNERIDIWLSKEKDNFIRIHNKGEIPEKIRDSFFKKFSTYGKKNGTGLGTYSAKLIVETHGGTIDFETSEENGTTLIAQIPNN